MIQAALAIPAGLSHELDALFSSTRRESEPRTPAPRAAALTASDPVEDRRLCEWVARIAAADEQALGLLYDATVGRVYGMARGITGTLHGAEAVTENVYWQVWRQALRFDRRRGPVMAWLQALASGEASGLPRGPADKSHEDDHRRDVVAR